MATPDGKRNARADGGDADDGNDRPRADGPDREAAGVVGAAAAEGSVEGDTEARA